jgi:hypothetical protein
MTPGHCYSDRAAAIATLQEGLEKIPRLWESLGKLNGAWAGAVKQMGIVWPKNRRAEYCGTSLSTRFRQCPTERVDERVHARVSED